MRDSTQLAADVYFPPGRRRRVPTILIRNTYNKGAMENGVRHYGVRLTATTAKTFTDNGYAVVIQDTRGRCASAGVDSIFRTDGAGPNQDGYDTIDWITQQSWSDGNVGMWGMSGLGITSYMAVASGHPALKAAYVVMCGSDLYRQVTFPGGVYQKDLNDRWVANHQGRAGFLSTLYAHSSYGEYWEAMDLSLHAPQAHASVYHWGGWFDVMSAGQTNGFRDLQERGGIGARGRQMLVMGPWSHGNAGRKQGAIEFPANAAEFPEHARDTVRPLNALLWFESRLRGVPSSVDSVPAVRYYLMGASGDSAGAGNRWMAAPTWPPPESRPVAYYLHSDGLLAPRPPAAGEQPRTYRYDPQNPVPTLGGSNLYAPIGPRDMRVVEARPDVLKFTTEPLSEPVAIAGNVRVRLSASSTGEDTDFMAMLCDVYPDGRSFNILDGAIRARHRQSLREEYLMTPGTVYEFDINLWDTAIVFERGHSIRLNITSSNTPRFQPNPNTANPFRADTVGMVVDNSVFNDATHPSALILPVIPIRQP
jgi:hypothetical protein